MSILFLAMALVSYSISQLAQHGKLRWESRNTYGFWGEDSDKRKYTSKIPFAKTWLVFLTDGYHLCQAIFLSSLSLSVTMLIGFQWVTLGLVWGGIHLLHWLVYKIASK